MQFLIGGIKIFTSLIMSLWISLGSCFSFGPSDLNPNTAYEPVRTIMRSDLNQETTNKPVRTAIRSDLNPKTTTESVWTTIRQEFILNHFENSPRVKAEIRKLLADRADLHNMLKAAVPYIYYMREQAATHDLPSEIALIPFIESSFNPNDHSKAGATGLWQLMPQTARELGVKVVKSKYDGRRNIIASTKAAIAYFRDLGKTFKGNWYLAIAAYNCGQGKVQSVKRHQSTDNFWSMKLPRETELYVPKLLALAAIIKNPEKYGVKLPAIANEPYFTALKVKSPVNLDRVAKMTNIHIDTLKALNPDYNHHGVMPVQSSYILVVPYNQAAEAKAHLAHEVIT